MTLTPWLRRAESGGASAAIVRALRHRRLRCCSATSAMEYEPSAGDPTTGRSPAFIQQVRSSGCHHAMGEPVRTTFLAPQLPIQTMRWCWRQR